MTLKRNGLGGYGGGEAQIKYAEERMGGEEQRWSIDNCFESLWYEGE